MNYLNEMCKGKLKNYILYCITGLALIVFVCTLLSLDNLTIRQTWLAIGTLFVTGFWLYLFVWVNELWKDRWYK